MTSTDRPLTAIARCDWERCGKSNCGRYARHGNGIGPDVFDWPGAYRYRELAQNQVLAATSALRSAELGSARGRLPLGNRWLNVLRTIVDCWRSRRRTCHERPAHLVRSPFPQSSLACPALPLVGHRTSNRPPGRPPDQTRSMTEVGLRLARSSGCRSHRNHEARPLDSRKVESVSRSPMALPLGSRSTHCPVRSSETAATHDY